MCLQSQEKEEQQKSLLFGAYTGNILFSDYLNEHCCLPTYETYHVLELPVLENSLECICHLPSWILDPGLQLLQEEHRAHPNTRDFLWCSCSGVFHITTFPKALKSADLII